MNIYGVLSVQGSAEGLGQLSIHNANEGTTCQDVGD